MKKNSVRQVEGNWIMIYTNSWHPLTALPLVISYTKITHTHTPHQKKPSTTQKKSQVSSECLIFDFNFWNYSSQKSHWNSGENLILKAWMLKEFRHLRWKHENKNFQKSSYISNVFKNARMRSIGSCVFFANIAFKKPQIPKQFIDLLKHAFKYII